MWMRFVAKCRACSILSTLIGLSSILICLSVFVLGYSIYRAEEISNAQKELEKIKKEYEGAVKLLNSIQNFSLEQYDNINKKSYTTAKEALGNFKNIFIAIAILTSQNGSREDAINAWKQALYADSDSRICHFWLGMEYFRAATETKLTDVASVTYLDLSIKNLSDKTLIEDSYAQYHLALSYLRKTDYVNDKNEKYEGARRAIAALEKVNAAKEPLGNIDRNFAYAYCIAGKYAQDSSLRKVYKNKSDGFFQRLKGLKGFEKFINDHYARCTATE